MTASATLAEGRVAASSLYSLAAAGEPDPDRAGRRRPGARPGTPPRTLTPLTYLRARPCFTQRCDDIIGQREDPCVRPNVASLSALSGSPCHGNCQATTSPRKLVETRAQRLSIWGGASGGGTITSSTNERVFVPRTSHATHS